MTRHVTVHPYQTESNGQRPLANERKDEARQMVEPCHEISKLRLVDAICTVVKL